MLNKQEQIERLAAIAGGLQKDNPRRKEQLAQAKREVETGLDLANSGFNSFVQRSIATPISQAIVDSCEILGEALPRVYLAQGWNDVPIKPDKNGMRIIAYADATGEAEGSISFYPYFLRDCVSRYDKGRFSIKTTALAETTAHEVYHLAQHRRYPRTVSAHQNRFAGDLKGWSQTPSDVAAQMFGIIYADGTQPFFGTEAQKGRSGLFSWPGLSSIAKEAFHTADAQGFVPRNQEINIFEYQWEREEGEV